MTAVLNGFRERAEKVAAVMAECRRLGIEVRPPDVQRSHALFTVETDASGAPEAIRFGLAAIKNVGEGAIEAIVAVRDGGEEPGPFPRSTTSAGASTCAPSTSASSSRWSRPAPCRRSDRWARCWTRWTWRWSGRAHQRDVAAGQSTLFDLFALPVEGRSAFLDGGEEIPRRERLRWEKELIGLYLSEHPLGDIAASCPNT